jgi:hypothetical protein
MIKEQADQIEYQPNPTGHMFNQEARSNHAEWDKEHCAGNCCPKPVLGVPHTAAKFFRSDDE